MSDQSGNIIQEDSQKPAIAAPAQKPVLTRWRKIGYFLIGFFGWWLVNTLVWVVYFRSPVDIQSFSFLFLIVLPANVLVLILMLIINRWVAFGILGAMATNLVIDLILGGIDESVFLVPSILNYLPF